MKHVLSFSGGKDSTAMLLRMIELNMPITEIRYFDCGSWEFPQMEEHINKIEKYIKRPINRILPKHDFDYYFFNHIKVKGKRKGEKGYGFPGVVSRWCTRIKIDAINKGLDPKDTILYIGYTINELARFSSVFVNKRAKIPRQAPLINWGWSEEDCLEYCYSKGFDWDGLYKYFDRVSCFCCPFQGLNQLRSLRKYFPTLWQQLLDMQKKSLKSFRMNGTTVKDLDGRFREEEKQGKLFEKI